MILSYTRLRDYLERKLTPWVAAYGRIFAVDEIEHSVILQWAFGALVFFFYLTFSSWVSSPVTSVDIALRGIEVCWPYFQNCGNWYFLHALPLGYSQTIFYMCLYAMLLCIVHAMWRAHWVRAHALLTIAFAWKFFVVFVLSYLIGGPYDYYHIAFTATLLFVHHKEFFLKAVFVLLYFLSGTTKFDETWVLGTYFSSLQTGLPLFPDSLIPVFTNLVIGMQVVGGWFLMSKQWVLQRGALVFFTAFHLYSGIFVYYHYPSVALPLLLILFGPMYRHTPTIVSKTSLMGWIFVCALIAFQLPPLFIEGDRRLTLEGNRYGMFMFEANHQCILNVRVYRKSSVLTSEITRTNSDCPGQTCRTLSKTYTENGMSVEESRYETGAAWNRCDPYVEWSRYHSQCKRDHTIARIALILDHSINGGPFYRIVNVDNICSLTYQPFSHNAWIVSPPEAGIVGYPVKDEYRY